MGFNSGFKGLNYTFISVNFCNISTHTHVYRTPRDWKYDTVRVLSLTKNIYRTTTTKSFLKNRTQYTILSMSGIQQKCAFFPFFHELKGNTMADNVSVAYCNK